MLTTTVPPDGHPMPESSIVLLVVYVEVGEVSVGLGVTAGGYEHPLAGAGLAPAANAVIAPSTAAAPACTSTAVKRTTKRKMVVRRVLLWNMGIRNMLGCLTPAL